MGDSSPRNRFALVGPAYPFRGGIAHYTTNLYRNLSRRYPVRLYTFTRQYPPFLFPGRTDRDPSRLVNTVPAVPIVDPCRPRTWLHFWQTLQEDPPDVVILQWWHPFWAPFLMTTARAVKRRLAARLLFICHNLIPHEGNRRLNLFLARQVLKQGDGYLVHSRWERDGLKRMFPLARVLWSPIPGDLFPTHLPPKKEAQHCLGLSGNGQSRVLLFFGFVRNYKGLHTLLQAMGRIREMNLHLVVVGEFWVDERPYHRLLQQLDLEEQVTLVSRYLPNEQVGTYFAAADAVVLPYLSASQSAVATLSLHMGRPVIASAVQGLTDVIEHEETGLLVPPGDPVALSQAIRRYFAEALEAPLSEKIQERIQGKAFHWERLVGTLEALSDGGGLSPLRVPELVGHPLEM